MSIYLYIIFGMATSFLLCMATILFYIRYKKDILKKQYQLKTAELQYQKDLLKAIINSQEEERKRIGMDLHDEVGSNLSSLRLMIENFADENIEGLTITQFSKKCKNTIDGIITDVRDISHNLSPIVNDAYGLYDAIYDFCAEINMSGKVAVDISVDKAAEEIKLEHFTKLSLYRVIAELINNTIKHAEAKNIFISIFLSGNLYKIVYKDDGKGISQEINAVKKGMGEKNIKSRLDSIGAAYIIRSNPGKGFEIDIDLPIHKQ